MSLRNIAGSVTTLALFASGLLLLSSCGGDSVQPKQPPRIISFTASPVDIVPGDSTLLSYSAQRATTLLLQPGSQTLADPATGSIWVSPPVPTTYSLLATNSDGTATSSLTVTMSTAVPSIGTLNLSADTLLLGDSTTISWQAVRADSIVIDKGVGKLASAVSGQLILSPSLTTIYTAIAFNNIGRDTVTVTVIVQDPLNVTPVSGLYYTGLMGQSIQTPKMSFRVVDRVGLNVSKLWIHFSLLKGDGLLSADSLLPVNSGVADLSYSFSGALGHAVIRAVVPGVDSVDVVIRANTLIPGIGGQGQFALFGEEWGMVKNFNGAPSKDDPDPNQFIQYQDFENQLGVVVMIRDTNGSFTADDFEPVLGVIVNKRFVLYPHKTADSIGINSHINDVLSRYAAPDNIRVDTINLPPGEPPGFAYDYFSEGLTFWISPADSLIFEIHIVDTSVAQVSGTLVARKRDASISQVTRPHRYRRELSKQTLNLTP